MNRDAARAQIFLDTFLPLLEEFVETRRGLRALARGVKSIQIETEQERLSRQLAVVNGEIKVGADLVQKPAFVLRFENLEQIGALLNGNPSALPKLNRWSLSDFTGAIVAAMSALLGAVLHPAVPLWAGADRNLRAKLILHAASYALESVARIVPEIHNIIEDVNGDVVQMGIPSAGLHIHLVFNPGEITAHRAAHPSPHAGLVFDSVDTFNGLVSRKLDPLKAWNDRRVRIEGESVLVLMAAALAQKLLEYLS